MELKVPIYIILPLVIVFLLITVMFGWAVYDNLKNPSGKSAFGDAVVSIASFPSQLKKLKSELYGKHPLTANDRFKAQKSGLTYFTKNKDNGYLLLSIYDGEVQQSVVKLIRLSDGRLLHQWTPDFDAIRSRSPSDNKLQNATLMEKKRARVLHPYLMEDGGLIFRNQVLVRIGACSKTKWVRSDLSYHHSIERGLDGNFWIPSVIVPSSFSEKRFPEYRDDAITKVSPNGAVLYTKSVAKILQENGYEWLIWGLGPYESDPIHLNDIQPALSSGKHWQTGDLMLSLRNRSTVLLFRPSTNKVIWLKTGPWSNQHDPDFISDTQISVFGNDIVRYSGGMKPGIRLMNSHNEVYVLDLGTSKITTPFSFIFKKYNIRTKTQGLSEITSDGSIFVEETNFGRIVKASGDILHWSYHEKIGDNRVAGTGWSRYLTADEVNSILPKLRCN